MRRTAIITAFVAAVTTTATTTAIPAPAQAAEIAISCGAVGLEQQLCREGATAWAEKTGHTVSVVAAPASASERLALYQQLLAAGAPDIDVFQIDVVWPGLLADHLLDLGEFVSDSELDDHLAVMRDGATVDGKLAGLPWFVDAGLLYYRRDLLEQAGIEVPQTWEALEAAAASLGGDDLWGYVWQGRAYEGLTCNALEWVASFGGGTIIDDDGRITIDNPDAAAALRRAAGWIGSISPPGVLNYQEEDARGLFQAGRAVFMRNWPYAWALVNSPDSPVAGKVGVAPLPRGPGAAGRHAAALGGWHLAVSRYSRHPQAAADLVAYLTGAPEQKRRAIAAAFNPTRPALYDDAEVLAANPFFARLGPIVTAAVARPADVAGGAYNRVSHAFYNAVHRVLSGDAKAEDALARLAQRLERITRTARRRP